MPPIEPMFQLLCFKGRQSLQTTLADQIIGSLKMHARVQFSHHQVRLSMIHYDNGSGVKRRYMALHSVIQLKRHLPPLNAV